MLFVVYRLSFVVAVFVLSAVCGLLLGVSFVAWFVLFGRLSLLVVCCLSRVLCCVLVCAGCCFLFVVSWLWHVEHFVCLLCVACCVVLFVVACCVVLCVVCCLLRVVVVCVCFC